MPGAITDENAVDEGPVPALGEDDIELSVTVDVADANVGGRLGFLLDEQDAVERRKRVRNRYDQDSEYKAERHKFSSCVALVRQLRTADRLSTLSPVVRRPSPDLA